MSLSSAVGIAIGRLFHNLGSTELKDPLCTNAILDLVMGRNLFVEELRSVWPCLLVMSPCRYEGAIPLRHLNTKTTTLKSILSATFSQWRLDRWLLCDHVSVAWIWPLLPCFGPFVTCSSSVLCRHGCHKFFTCRILRISSYLCLLFTHFLLVFTGVYVLHFREYFTLVIMVFLVSFKLVLSSTVSDNRAAEFDILSTNSS